ncbi:sensor histidine kinase [Virgibacillus necropolis]|uniref:ATP-binding protein n=1 Tax=Virgibacillus necropolis TaxID=163877 RepID=UPI00385163A4
MEKILNVSLQTKILGLIISLVLFVVILLTGIFAYIEYKETQEQTKQLALQTAKTVSFMPTIKEAFLSKQSSADVQRIAEQVRVQVGAASVIVSNRNETMYSHPNPEEIGKKILGDDNYKALVFGGYYNSEYSGRLGAVIRGKAPIFIDKGKYKKLVGVVTVGFSKEKIQSMLLKNLLQSGLFALLVIVLGITGSVFLARNIKKDTLGLEPYEIASLYRERNATLLAIKEGVLAIDDAGNITMLNNSAKELLGLTEQAIRQPIEKYLPNTGMLEVLQTGVKEKDREMVINDKAIIVNRTPVIENGGIVGVVSSFRNKTEIQDMINTLSEVRMYSEDLRAQTHEFTNKLYVLSGLLQLGKYDEAIDMIQEESTVHKDQNRILFDQIHDSNVQAILLGKISKASEKKVNFSIDENSSLQTLPEHMGISQLATMIGNIIDNAFEAVESSNKNNEMNVSFFAIDMGHDVLFEVSDSGVGITEDQMDHLFKTGFSMKGNKNRGYGLANVQKVVEDLNGDIEITNRNEGGTIFTIFLPKEAKEGDH